MTITSYQIRSVLRTYGQQLRRTLRERHTRGLTDQQRQIPPEVKRKQVIEQVAREVLTKITVDGVFNETGKAALAKLVHEVGQNLEIIPHPQGEWKINPVSNPESPKEIKGQFGSPNLDAWKERLYQITYEIIDQNTIGLNTGRRA